NNGGKARRVVTAALVGVLSVGAVPAIALATGADVSLQAQDPAGDLKDAKLVAATNGTSDIEVPEKGTITLAPGEYLVPTQIKPEFGDTIDLDYTGDDANAVLGYYKADDLSTNIASQDSAEDYDWVAGKYVVRVRITDKDSAYFDKTVEYRFNVVGTDLDDAVIFNAADGNEDTTVDEFVWNKEKQSIGVAVDGVVLKNNKDYQIKYGEAGGSWDSATTTAPTNAGSYIAYIADADWKYVKQIAFTIEKLNLSTADLQIGDMTYDEAATAFGNADTGITKVTANGVELVKPANKVDIKLNSGFVGTGKYTAHVKASEDAANFEGEGDATFYVVKKVLQPTDFYYGDDFLTDAPTEIDLSEGQSFDLSKVNVKDGTTKLDSDLVDVWVTDINGNVVDDAKLKTAGTWKVCARVNAEASEEWAYGSNVQTVTVKVVNGKVATDEYAFLYKGEVVDAAKGIEAEYDGTDVLDDVTVVVKDGDETLEEGDDYTLEVKGEDGKVVDSIVDAGEYTLTVKGNGYEISGTKSIKVKVTAMKLDSAKVVSSLTASGTSYLAYTGEAIEPSFTFYKDGVEVEVPAGSYEASYKLAALKSDGRYDTPKAVEEVKDLGKYTATFEAAKGVKNYDFSLVKPAEFEVTDKKVFLDVPANEWYSQAVYDAATNGYMTGDGGGKTFGPMRELTRAEAACVLFNMAGGNNYYDDATIPGYVPNGNVYETGYSDVAGNEFFAKAVAWCKATGIINGYADGTFGVSRFVTNEEFACMLANYAKAKNEYKAVDADEVLAAYPDASVVSDWAKDSVAWAVSEGIMGGGATISPAGSILRMRAATMAVNAQPEKAGSALI
ncbi:S-layer homology domain-containing protein, partial [Olsenella sp. An293]|uniref:S-layer homology domain-containing protein n=1 Tax=Olsenella sp. An293 TaxID=1965626 RepID=UPI000B55E53F